MRVCGVGLREFIARAILALHGFLSFTHGLLYLTAVTLWKLRAGQAIISAAYVLSIVPESMKIDKSDIHFDNSTNPVSDIGPFLNAMFYYVLGFGVVMAVYGIIVFIAACCRNRVLLIIFALFAAFQVLTNTVSCGLLFSGKFNGAFKRMLNHTMVEFRGIDTTEINSVMWNYGQIQMKCCGVDNYTDFQYASEWRKHRLFDVAGGKKNRTLTTPMACCKFNGKVPHISPVDETCSYRASSAVTNWDQGCWEAIGSCMGKHRGTAIGVCAAIIVWEILIFLLTVYLIRAIRRRSRKRGKVNETDDYKPLALAY